MNKELKTLESIYEDMLGYNTPQYGSSSPLSTPTGTETLKSKYVEVPDIEKDIEKDDEDLEGEPSIKKVFDSLIDVIRKIKNLQKEKISKELDKRLE